MTKHISVEWATLVGGVWVNLPVSVIMFGGWFGEIMLARWGNVHLGLGPLGSIVFVVVALIAPFVLAWLWWSVSVPKWRIWALERTGDWPALERQAIKDKLIWDERTWWGRMFARTEISSAKDKQRTAELKRRPSAS